MPRRSAASLHFPAFTRVERLTPPPELSPDERALFIDIVGAIPADHFRPRFAADLQLCRAILLEREAAEHLAAQGHVSIDNKPSAWLGIQPRRQDDAVARPGAEADADRAQAVQSRAGKPQPPTSYYDHMRLEQEGDT